LYSVTECTIIPKGEGTTMIVNAGNIVVSKKPAAIAFVELRGHGPRQAEPRAAVVYLL
jgi:hypothetical protein